jgi:hypothetical protein
MRRVVGLGLFLLAAVAFFLVNHIESKNRTAAIKEEVKSFTAQIGQKGGADPLREQDPKDFLESQQKILDAAKDKTPIEEITSSYTALEVPAASKIVPYMPLIVTVVFGLAAFWVILSKGYTSDQKTRKWAFGVLGLIVGYWLKGAN